MLNKVFLAYITIHRSYLSELLKTALTYIFLCVFTKLAAVIIKWFSAWSANDVKTHHIIGWKIIITLRYCLSSVTTLLAIITSSAPTRRYQRRLDFHEATLDKVRAESNEGKGAWLTRIAISLGRPRVPVSATEMHRKDFQTNAALQNPQLSHAQCNSGNGHHRENKKKQNFNTTCVPFPQTNSEAQEAHGTARSPLLVVDIEDVRSSERLRDTHGKDFDSLRARVSHRGHRCPITAEGVGKVLQMSLENVRILCRKQKAI